MEEYPVLYHVRDQSISYCLPNGSAFFFTLERLYINIKTINILPTTSFLTYVWHIYVLSNKLVSFSLTCPTFSSYVFNKLTRHRRLIPWSTRLSQTLVSFWEKEEKKLNIIEYIYLIMLCKRDVVVFKTRLTTLLKTKILFVFNKPNFPSRSIVKSKALGAFMLDAIFLLLQAIITRRKIWCFYDEYTLKKNLAFSSLLCMIFPH